MKTKYYTPSIEEFHHGFEYEIFEDFDIHPEKSWHKQIFGINGDDQKNIDYVSANRLDNIRVKYLDREDIESLGFRSIENRDAEFGAIDAYWSDKTEVVLHTYPENKIRISGGVYEPRFLFFHGTIKNKSELINIMRIIGCYS